MVKVLIVGILARLVLTTGYTISVGYISSSETAPSRSALSSIKGAKVASIDVNSITDSNDLDFWLEKGAFHLIYDRGGNERVSFAVSSRCNTKTIVYLLAWDTKMAAKLNAIYPFDSELEGQEVTLKALRELNVPEISLISNDFKAKEAFQESLAVTVAEHIDDNTPQTSIDKIVSRSLKQAGVRCTVLDLSSETASRALLGLQHSKMMQGGYACLISQKTQWLVPSQAYEGLLWLAEEGTEAARSLVDVDYLNLAWMLPKVDQTNLKSEIQRVLASRGTKLMNVLSAAWVEVGHEAPTGFLLTTPVTYFGGLQNFDFNLPVFIPLTTVSGPETANGLDYGNPEVFKGFFIAVDKIHAEGILGRFQLVPLPLPSGATASYPEFSRAAIIKYRDRLGICTVGSFSSGAVLGLLTALQIEKINQPVIGGHNWGIPLSDKKVYPNFVRITKRFPDMIPGIAQFYKHFGYLEYNIFITDDSLKVAYAQAAKQSLTVQGITCLTPEETWPIKQATIDDPLNHLEQGELVQSSNKRPIILLAYTNARQAMLDILHKLGLRPEDVVLLFDSFYNEVANDDDPDVVKYRTNFIDKSFYIDFAAFVGTIGGQAKQIIEDSTGMPASAGNCQFYDSAYFVAYTVKGMIMKGEDFEDHDLFNDRMRKTQMYGCSGRIIIESDTNDRSSQDIDFYNTRYIDGVFENYLAYRISLTSSTFITEVNVPIWPGNSTVAPLLDIYNYGDCPFPEEYRQDYEDEGVKVMGYLGAAIGGVAAVTGIVAYFLSRRDSPEPISEVFEGTFEDLLMQYAVFFNALQYLALGPALKTTKRAASALNNTLIGPYGAFDIEGESYWKFINVIFAIYSVWLIGFVLVVLRYNQVRVRKLAWLTAAAVYLVPFISFFLFLPLLLPFLDLYVCTEAHSPPGTSPSLDDSFMDKDCKHDCWSGTHLTYSISTCILICLFIVTQTFATPMWQALKTDLSIKARRSYLHLKSLIEIVLLLNSHILRRSSESTHAIVHIIALALFLLETSLRRPFSYSRTSLWLRVCLSICLMLGGLGFIQMQVDSLRGDAGDAIAAGIVGVALGEVYLVIGLIVQSRWMPNLVKSTKAVNEGDLFKFAFNFKNIAPPQSILGRTVNFVPRDPSVYEEPESPSQLSPLTAY
jgi:hypothetical protein